MRRNPGRLVLSDVTSFKHPSFQDRAGQAAAEKRKSWDRLRLRPEPDELVAGACGYNADDSESLAAVGVKDPLFNRAPGASS